MNKDVSGILSNFKTHSDLNVSELTFEIPLIFIFLRHLGCTFCRETLHDVARQRQSIELEGAGIVLVHMSPQEEAEEVFERYGLKDVIHISDPDQELYRAFSLQRGGLLRMMGLKVWIRGFIAGVMNGHGYGGKMGDVMQMPGVFLVHEGKILLHYRHKSPADRPDYVQLATYPFELGKIAAVR